MALTFFLQFPWNEEKVSLDFHYFLQTSLDCIYMLLTVFLGIKLFFFFFEFLGRHLSELMLSGVARNFKKKGP